MLKLLREVIRVGEATAPYPSAPLPLAPGFRGKPQHIPERCLACAACAIACPSNALALTNDLERGIRTWSFLVGRCIFCGRCEEVCPTGAIALTPDFELAVLNKADLVAQAEFRLTACRMCGRFFAPAAEVDYAIGLLRQAGLPEDQLADRRAALETCPECRRKRDASRITGLTVRQPAEAA